MQNGYSVEFAICFCDELAVQLADANDRFFFERKASVVQESRLYTKEHLNQVMNLKRLRIYQ